MSTRFTDFMAQVEAEALAAGPEAVSELDAFHVHFKAEVQRIGGRRVPFDMELPTGVMALSSLFTEAGFRLYVVGGAVRDALLGEVPKDFDLATNAVPDQVVKLLKGTFWVTTEVGKSFGVVVASLRHPDKGERTGFYEVATFRQDVGEGRHPSSVRFTTIEEDVKRRDLTVNALFYDIGSREVVDLVGGLADIAAQVVRAVGVPADRFREDPLRVLRAIRFATRLGWSIDVPTWDAMCDNRALVGVSADRIHDELTRALASAKSPNVVFDMLGDAGLWPRVLPWLRVSRRTMGSRKLSVALATVLDESDERHVAKLLNEVRYSDLETRQVSFLMRFHKELSPQTAPGLRKAFLTAQLSVHDLCAFYCHRGGGHLRGVKAFLAYLSSPPVKGDDLMAAGFSGKDLGMELTRQETELFRGLL